MIFLLDITYDVNEAIEYFNILDRDYQYLHWDYFRDHENINAHESINKLDKFNGWGLQTIFNINIPYHPDIDPHDQGPEFFKNTELIFGFVKKVFDTFILPYRSFILVRGKGTHMNMLDPPPQGPPHYKVIIPIKSNNDSIVISHDTISKTEFILEVNKVYLLETHIPFEILNNGDDEDILLYFHVPAHTFDQLINMKCKI
jgi:hypothetical protein